MLRTSNWEAHVCFRHNWGGHAKEKRVLQIVVHLNTKPRQNSDLWAFQNAFGVELAVSAMINVFVCFVVAFINLFMGDRTRWLRVDLGLRL